MTFADEAAPGARVVAVVGLLDRGPVPVLVTVGMGDPDESGRRAHDGARCDGGNPVNPPNIEYPELPDGDGIQVTRLDLDQATAAPG